MFNFLDFAFGKVIENGMTCGSSTQAYQRGEGEPRQRHRKRASARAAGAGLPRYSYQDTFFGQLLQKRSQGGRFQNRATPLAAGVESVSEKSSSGRFSANSQRQLDGRGPWREKRVYGRGCFETSHPDSATYINDKSLQLE